MGNVSKTARASAVQERQSTQKLTPEETIKQLRQLRESRLFAHMHQVDALLAAYDSATKEAADALALLNTHLKGRIYTSLDDALRNMLQAYVSMKGNLEDQRQAGYRAIAGVDSSAGDQ